MTSSARTVFDDFFRVSGKTREVGQDYDALGLSSLRGRNVVPGPARRAKGPNLDADRILARAQVHRRFRHHNIQYRNLPEFEALYQSDEAEGEAHLKSEIERLVAAANQTDGEATSTTSNGSSAKFRKSRDSTTATGVPSVVCFGKDSESDISVKDLLTCIDHLQCNLALVVYKNALLVVQSLRWCHSSSGVSGIFEMALRAMNRTRRVLISRLIPHSQFIETDPPFPLHPGSAAYALYDVIVDYITSSVARTILESADGPTWCDTSVAVLARLSRKLKNLKSNARRYADEAISSAEFLHEDLRDENTDAGKHIVFHFDGDSYDVVDDSIYLKDYFVQQLYYRSSLCGILEDVLSTVQLGINDQSLGIRQKEFDFNVMCQKAESNFPLLVSSDARQNISATTNETAMGLSVTGCRLLMSLARDLSSRKAKLDPHVSVGVLRWWWIDNTINDTAQAVIDTVEESFSILVALAMAGSTVASELASLLEFASSLDEDAGEVRAFQPKTDLHLAFTFARSQKRNDPTMEKDTIRLADFVQRSYLVESPHEEIANPGASLRKQRRQYEMKISNWTIDSETITIHRPWVVIGIVLPSLIIALAGVSLMLAPYKRPKGVDPSNFMIFLWSIALSFLLVGKAFFVPDWPWHDFLRGNVACRSVSEVARISGVDEQVVMMQLLYDRHGLAVKGPYDTVFSGSTDKAASTIGFSIDVPIDLKTLYASGFLILKVDNYERPRLVCLRGAEDADFDSRAHKMMRLVGDVPSLARQRSEFGTKIRLSREAIHWQHVFGLYVDPTTKFV